MQRPLLVGGPSGRCCGEALALSRLRSVHTALSSAAMAETPSAARKRALGRANEEAKSLRNSSARRGSFFGTYTPQQVAAIQKQLEEAEKKQKDQRKQRATTDAAIRAITGRRRPAGKGQTPAKAKKSPATARSAPRAGQALPAARRAGARASERQRVARPAAARPVERRSGPTTAKQGAKDSSASRAAPKRGGESAPPPSHAAAHATAETGAGAGVEPPPVVQNPFFSPSPPAGGLEWGELELPDDAPPPPPMPPPPGPPPAAPPPSDAEQAHPRGAVGYESDEGDDSSTTETGSASSAAVRPSALRTHLPPPVSPVPSESSASTASSISPPPRELWAPAPVAMGAPSEEEVGRGAGLMDTPYASEEEAEGEAEEEDAPQGRKEALAALWRVVEPDARRVLRCCIEEDSRRAGILSTHAFRRALRRARRQARAAGEPPAGAGPTRLGVASLAAQFGDADALPYRAVLRAALAHGRAAARSEGSLRFEPVPAGAGLPEVVGADGWSLPGALSPESLTEARDADEDTTASEGEGPPSPAKKAAAAAARTMRTLPARRSPQEESPPLLEGLATPQASLVEASTTSAAGAAAGADPATEPGGATDLRNRVRRWRLLRQSNGPSSPTPQGGRLASGAAAAVIAPAVTARLHALHLRASCSLSGEAFLMWRRAATRVAHTRKAGRQVQLARAARVQRRAWHGWRRVTRATARAGHKLPRALLLSLQASADAAREEDQMDRAADTFHRTARRAHGLHALRAFAHARAEGRARAQRADGHWRAERASSALARWRSRAADAALHRAALDLAASHATTTLARRALGKLRAAGMRRWGEEAAADHDRRRRLSAVLAHWRGLTEHRRSAWVREREVTLYCTLRAQARALHVWRDTAAANSALRSAAAHHRRRALLAGVAQWRATARRHARALDSGRRVAHARAHRNCRRALATWRGALEEQQQDTLAVEYHDFCRMRRAVSRLVQHARRRKLSAEQEKQAAAQWRRTVRRRAPHDTAFSLAHPSPPLPRSLQALHRGVECLHERAGLSHVRAVVDAHWATYSGVRAIAVWRSRVNASLRAQRLQRDAEGFYRAMLLTRCFRALATYADYRRSREECVAMCGGQ